MHRLIALLCLAATTALAQIGTSTMTGRVTDSTGATVPNCTVVIVQKGTNFTFTAKSNQEGIYRAPSLQPGQYRVTFE